MNQPTDFTSEIACACAITCCAPGQRHCGGTGCAYPSDVTVLQELVATNYEMQDPRPNRPVRFDLDPRVQQRERQREARRRR